MGDNALIPAWRVSLTRKIAPYLNRLDDVDAASFTPELLAKLGARERELDMMLETPVAKATLARLLARLDIMAAGVVSPEEGLAHARLEVEIMLKPPALSEFAIDAAVMAFLSGARGDGRWRPKPGELRREAERLCEPLRKELHDIRLLQARAKQPAKELIGRERRAELADMLRQAAMLREALSWAHRQICGNVARKAVLMALANWADSSGFVKTMLFEHLEQATELSRSGVYQRLRELDASGAFTRERGHHADGRTVSARLNLDGCFSLPQEKTGSAPLPVSTEGWEIRDGEAGRTVRVATPAAAGSPRQPDWSRRLAGKLEPRCRALVGSSPAAACIDFSPIARLVAEGASEADVLGGIRAAMAIPGFRPRSWAVFEQFVRRERTLRTSAARGGGRPSPEGIVSHRMRALKQIHDEALAEEEARNGG